jgi:hypothetical protein
MAMAAAAQNVTSRTSEFEVNTSDAGATVNAVVPVITWITPEKDNVFQETTSFHVILDIYSPSQLESITIAVKNKLSSSEEKEVQLEGRPNEKSRLEFDVELAEGQNLVEVEVETVDGVKGSSRKSVHVGAVSLAGTRNLNRTDYALVFATDQYEHWPDLVNPVFDSRAIADELKHNYGYQVEVVENATQNEILTKIREYIEKQYKPLDQLFIFFAGHGTFDQTFNEGYLVPREALIKDEAKTSYLSYNRLRSVVNNVPCQHIFLAMDVCFGGTFDEELDDVQGLDGSNVNITTPEEFVTRKLTHKTRKFITSGDKQYVSDGAPGQHSPFAKAFLEALRSGGGSDGILTLREITPYVLKLKIKPRAGEFGDNAPGSDFIFVSR